MSAADTWIKRTTVVAVLIVAAVAAGFSYQHALDVVRLHSRPSLLDNVSR
jgi:hypothetical protein